MNTTAMTSEVGMAERRRMKWGMVFLCPTIRMIAEKLRARWPAEAAAMPYYPAFRSQV